MSLAANLAMVPRLEHRLLRPGATALVAAALLCSAPAEAQVPGDVVHLETTSGPVDGTLIDRVPEGYLVRAGEQTRVVPYRSVVSIAPGAPAAPEAAPPLPAASPPPAPLAEPSRVEKQAPPAPASALYRAGSGLAALGLLGAVAGVVLIPTGMSTKSAGQCRDVATGDTYDCDYKHGGRMITAGLVSLGVGGALLVGGIPLMVVGRRQAAREAEPAKAAESPALLFTASSASLVWRF